MIKFERVTNCEGLDDVSLPHRSTEGSAGYDFYAIEDVTIPSIWDVLSPSSTGYRQGIRTNYVTVARTGVKATFPKDVVLNLYSRSSLAIKKGLILPNSVGVIDSDYYGNVSNEGEILFAFINVSPVTQKIRKGQKIGQGVFMPYLLTDDDVAEGIRMGGIGSTGG